MSSQFEGYSASPPLAIPPMVLPARTRTSIGWGIAALVAAFCAPLIGGLVLVLGLVLGFTGSIGYGIFLVPYLAFWATMLVLLPAVVCAVIGFLVRPRSVAGIVMGVIALVIAAVVATPLVILYVSSVGF